MLSTTIRKSDLAGRQLQKARNKRHLVRLSQVAALIIRLIRRYFGGRMLRARHPVVEANDFLVR
ncbi:MAG: hypothetical protein L0H41_10150 [Microlunatus sp.]|nr:hypothetical protein [Microlunatus sp.]